MPVNNGTNWRQKMPGAFTCLFWNINARNILQSIQRLVEQYSVDVLILAECQLSHADIDRALNPAGRPAEFHHVKSACDRITLYTRFPDHSIKPVSEADKYAIFSLQISDKDEILLVAAHLLSLTQATEKTLYVEAELFAADIRRVEKEREHERTLVVGDLNMNPFADGMVSAIGLHATMSRRIAQEKTRSVMKNEYSFFFNPMWNYMRERFDAQTQTYSPPGTFYYRNSDHVCYFWNVFDQVLLRPDLLNRWDDANLQVITSAGDRDLLTKSARHPGGKYGSDHLPIVFMLQSAVEIK